MATKKLSWGFGDVEEWPDGAFDDVDAEIVHAEYRLGDYGVQLFMVMRPADYEYAPRFMDVPEDDFDIEADRNPGFIFEYYGMGDREDSVFEVSDDGMEVLAGPRPSKRTQLGSLIKGLVEEAGSRLKNTTNLSQLVGISCHWGQVSQGRNRNNKMMPIGSTIGRAVERAAKNSVSRPSAGRANDAADTTTPATTRPVAGNRRTAEETQEPAQDNEVGSEGSIEDRALELLVTAAAHSGDTGISKARLVKAITDSGLSDDDEVIKAASKRTTIAQAKENELIVEEDGKLYSMD